MGAEGSYTGTGTNGAAMTAIDLSSVTELQQVQSGNAVTFRMYAWGATGAAGTIALGRRAGNDLSFAGELGPGSIVAFEEAGQTGDQINHNATTLNSSLQTAELTRGSGLNPSGLLNAFSSNGFVVSGTKTIAIENSNYVQVHIVAKSGYRMSLYGLNSIIRRSPQGPTTFQWQYSLDEFSTPGTDIGPEVLYNGIDDLGVVQAPIDLSGVLSLQTQKKVTLRLYAWGATSGGGTFALGRNSGPEFQLAGTVSPNIIIGFDPNGLAGNEPSLSATTLNSHLQSVQISRGSGITSQLSSDAFASTGFDSATRTTAILADEYYQFNVHSQNGYYIDFTSIFQNNLRTASGPTTYQWQYSLDEFSTPGNEIGAPQVYTGVDLNGRSATNTSPFDILSLQNATDVSYRLYAWGAAASTGTFAFGRLSGDDLALSGEVNIYTHTVTYTAADGGFISGSTTQLINYNSSTIPVTATAFSLNQFSHWSDGRVDNPRYDQNVINALNLTAYFEAIPAAVPKGGGSFIPPKSIGAGKRESVVEINEAQDVGIVDAGGVNLLVKTGSQSTFKINNDASKPYILSLDYVDLSEPLVRFKIIGTPHVLQLRIKDSRILDLNSDGIQDISIQFTNVYINRIELTLIPVHGGSIIPSQENATSYQFIRELQSRSTGDDVKELQKYLNSHGFLIAKEGPGSPGNETKLFGALTRNALIRYQQAHKIRTTGILGPLTRASINSSLKR